MQKKYLKYYKILYSGFLNKNIKKKIEKYL